MEMEQQNVINENGVKNGNVSEEDMFVDDLIDFSKAEEYGVCSQDEEEPVPFHLESISNMDSAPLPFHDAGLCLSADEEANLEWLSNFIDDSIHGFSLTIPVDNIRVKPDPKPSLKENCCGTFSVKTKARSKRVRNSGRVWSLNDSACSSSSSSCPPNQLVLYNDASQSAEKKSVKKPKLEKQDGGEPRRCSHCLVQKTPQWRAGPLGAKTLCNACGVRYKSGRLLPEYRPAISPTFSSEKHSNNHRKVMEMRRRNKGDGGYVMPPVESFSCWLV